MKAKRKFKTKNVKKITSTKVSPLGDLLDRYKGVEPPKSFWAGISPKMVGFVFGLAKSGKTIICENLALSITSGRNKFLGIPIDIPNSKVLFISMEENVGIRIIQRGNKQIRGYSSEEKKNIKENLYYSDEEFLRSVENIQDWVFIEDEIKKYRPNIVFVDSTNRFNIDIENRDETNKMMQRVRKFADKFDCAIILIHHTNKAQKNKTINESHMSGSSALARDADFFIGINSLSNGTRYIKFITNRYSQTPDECIVFSIQDTYLVDFEGQEYESVLIKSLDGRYDSNNTEKILDFIKENVDDDNTIKTKPLQNYFVDKNGLITKKTLHNQIKKLIKMEQLKKVGHGKYKLVIVNQFNSESVNSVDN